ncbi:MAG: hypothetical protein E7260_00305 [Lachnospiraceae bacterium]|nr:hypothetical protein [Lachnospiraceae bacterium]
MNNESEEKKYTPLLPYDGNYGENFTTYQTMVYHCDRDACYPYVGTDSGNMIKYYSYQIQESPTPILTEE